MNKNLKAPQWVDALLEDLAPDELEEEIRGDLYELFLNDVSEKGVAMARRKYIFNALGFLVKSFFWKRSSSTGTNSFAMLANYFKMARRSLMAYKGTSIINMLGLVTGIAAALVIATVIRYELSFNKSHSDVERIYRVVRVSGDDMSEFRTGVSYPVPAAMKEGMTSLENITSMEYFGGAYVDVMDSTGKSVAMFREDFGCVMVDSSFFKIFDFGKSDFKWIAGNPEKALLEPFNVVLTESMAKKYFPDGDALGKAIRFEKFYDAKVTGVIADFPPNCDFPFTILISYSSIEVMRRGGMDNWYGVNDRHQAYVKLANGFAQGEAEAQIHQVHAAHTPKDLHDSRHYLLQPLSDVHHDARFGTYSGRTISKQTVLALGLIGVFLLLTACINYINLSTAQSTQRSKEIGLRKVLGSFRKNLVGQFLTETFVLVLVSGLVALVVAELLLINLQQLLTIKLIGYNFTDPFVILILAVFIVVVTLFAGFYPSFVISGFSPISALKNKFSTETFRNISLRKILVVAQFAITQILVVGTFIVVSQMRYFNNVDMGFNRDATITLNLPNTSVLADFRSLENQIKSQSFVAGVTFSSTLPSGVRRNRNFMDIGKKDAVNPKDMVVFEYQVIDPSYFEVYDIKIMAGRNLEASDTTGNIMINNALARNLGFRTPEEAIGQELKMAGQSVTVAGVADDFYSNSLKEGVDNMAFVINPRASDFCSIKLHSQGGTLSLPEAVKEIEKIWANTYPEHIFNYEFLDENIHAFYAQEEKYANLFQLFASIFIVIGCLGLYGLITFAVNRKAKEVAIRKVHGATTGQVLFMFSREYMLLILVSFVIAVPVAYVAVESWLRNFANRIPLQWWLFAIPGLFVLCIALFVIMSKSLVTANANPVDKLKYE